MGGRIRREPRLWVNCEEVSGGSPLSMGPALHGFPHIQNGALVFFGHPAQTTPSPPTHSPTRSPIITHPSTRP
eukprot:1154960-Pyramimonas_sp.AAC.1